MRSLGILAIAVVMSLPVPASAQPAGELAAARQALGQLQGRSFAENREYCGYIGIIQNGQYAATEVTRGRSDSCLSRGDESRFVEVTASFHTHAGFDTEADSEVPSSNDVEGDMSEGVNGYVATPGGRLWFIDGRTGVATQICGLGCMGQDPRFIAGDAGPIAPRYTLQQLRQRESHW